MREKLEKSCDAIEECYEFMLAYAAQGLAGDQGSHSGSQLRGYLTRAACAIADLADTFTALVKQENLQPADKYHTFISVLDRDASEALAAIELVLAQPSLSSQLIDNLNASIHVRALLTDLFLIDEIAKPSPPKPVAAP
ncbi:MAG: hypothetical protein ABSA57_13535 [Candidatus Acidiferrales bacterium]|jgi:hypothetical protein